MKKQWKRMLLVLLGAVMLLAGCGEKPPAPKSDAQEATPGQTMTLPCALEDGRLVVESVFQYSGMNPDCDNQEGTDIAAVEVRNASVLHLEKAELTLIVEGGEEILFVVEDMPAGASAMVFSRENQTMDEGSEREIRCKAEFVQEAPMAQDRVRVAADGMTITLTNVSEEDMTNVKVYCHSLLNESCYGGSTYCYTIDEIEAGATAAVEATDCYLDGAMPVRIKE